MTVGIRYFPSKKSARSVLTMLNARTATRLMFTLISGERTSTQRKSTNVTILTPALEATTVIASLDTEEICVIHVLSTMGSGTQQNLRTLAPNVLTIS